MTYTVLLMSSAPGAETPTITQIEVPPEAPENPDVKIDADDALAFALSQNAQPCGTDAIVAVVMPTEPEDGTAQFGLRAAGIFAAIQGGAAS